MVNPQMKTWKSFLHLNFLIVCTCELDYLTSLATALKCFQIVPGKHRKLDVTTMFAYSHLNTPIDQ